MKFWPKAKSQCTRFVCLDSSGRILEIENEPLKIRLSCVAERLHGSRCQTVAVAMELTESPSR